MIKGDIRIGRTGIFDRRADQGLRAASISTEEVLVRHSAAWQALESTSGNDLVTLPAPDTEGLPNGWTVVIENTGDTTLNVETSNSGNPVTTIDASSAKRLTLTDNSDDDGVWFVEDMVDAGSQPATRFTLTHDATTDWGSPADGYYTITTAAGTHGRGTRPMIQFYETIATNEVEVTPDQSRFATSDGMHFFRVPNDPDLRYAGKAIFI